MHTLFDNMTDAEFVRWLERHLIDTRKDQIVARVAKLIGDAYDCPYCGEPIRD